MTNSGLEACPFPELVPSGLLSTRVPSGASSNARRRDENKKRPGNASGEVSQRNAIKSEETKEN